MPRVHTGTRLRSVDRKSTRGGFGRLSHLFLATTLLFGLLLSSSHVTAEHEPPSTAQDFTPFVAGPSIEGDPFTQGFGDRDNSWAWSMMWWKDKLYVGTSRTYRCFSRASLFKIAGFFFPYPPPDKDQDCDADPAMLDLQAEIWAWTPPQPGGNPRGTWEEVFQSPKTVQVPGRSDTFVAHDVGFRGMVVHTDKNADGEPVERLYAVGVNTGALWEGTGAVPPPRILSTSTGKQGDWHPIPQQAGTFIGDLTKGSLRSPTSYNDKLFVLNGTVQGGGVLLASDDPLALRAKDTWQQVDPLGRIFFEMEVFNGWLYLGGFDPKGGYTVIKTNAEGDPYTFTTVVPAGALLKREDSIGVKPSGSVVSMHVFEGRLYVGTDNPAELIRINPDDTWELLVGSPRRSPTGTWIYPLSGLEDGFAHQFNDHIWRQGSRDGFLYAGTYDAMANWKDDAEIGPRYRHLQGTDVYRTADGWYWTPITLNGFGDPFSPGPQDPRPDPSVPPETGGRFNFGTRSFADTPFGLFIGLANDFYGLNIYRASPSSERRRFLSPARAEAEIHQNRPVLSWEPVPGAVRYRVLRAQMEQVNLRPFPIGQTQETNTTLASLGVEAQSSGATDAESGILATTTNEDGSTGDSTSQGPSRMAAWLHKPFEMIATTQNPAFVDAPLKDGERRQYLIIAEDAQGRTSENSNLVLVPMLRPPTTFTELLTRMNVLQQRDMFTSEDMAGAARYLVQQASGLAVANRMPEASDMLERLRQQVLYGSVVFYPEAKDLEVLVSKLIRRMKLVHNGYIQHQALYT